MFELFERTNWKALWHHTIHCVTSQTSRGKPRGKLSMEGVQIFCQIFHILIKRQSHAYRSEGWAALAEREQLWKDEFYLKKRRGSSGESSGAKYSTIADCRRARLWNILSLSSASSPSFPTLSASFSSLDSSLSLTTGVELRFWVTAHSRVSSTGAELQNFCQFSQNFQGQLLAMENHSVSCNEDEVKMLVLCK